MQLVCFKRFPSSYSDLDVSYFQSYAYAADFLGHQKMISLFIKDPNSMSILNFDMTFSHAIIFSSLLNCRHLISALSLFSY